MASRARGASPLLRGGVGGQAALRSGEAQSDARKRSARRAKARTGFSGGHGSPGPPSSHLGRRPASDTEMLDAGLRGPSPCAKTTPVGRGWPARELHSVSAERTPEPPAMGSRASRVDVMSRRARPGSIVGLRGSHGGEVVLARRCMMTEGESAGVSPHGAAHVNGVSNRLIDGPRSARTRKRQCTISPKAREALRGATDRRPVNELPARSCAARSETAHSSGFRKHSACTEKTASSPAEADALQQGIAFARGRDHPDLASRPGKRGASSRQRGSPVSSPRLQIPSTKVSGHHVRT